VIGRALCRCGKGGHPLRGGKFAVGDPTPSPLSLGQSSDGHCFFVDGIVQCAVHAPDDSRAPSGRSPSWTPGASAVS
jgi:hypothetical protein